MELPKELKNDIWEFCRVNDITNIDGFVIKLIRQAFTIEKYGATPMVKKPVEEPRPIETKATNVVELENKVEKEAIEIVEIKPTNKDLYGEK